MARDEGASRSMRRRDIRALVTAAPGEFEAWDNINTWTKPNIRPLGAAAWAAVRVYEELEHQRKRRNDRYDGHDRAVGFTQESALGRTLARTATRGHVSYSGQTERDTFVDGQMLDDSRRMFGDSFGDAFGLSLEHMDDDARAQISSSFGVAPEQLGGVVDVMRQAEQARKPIDAALMVINGLNALTQPSPNL